MKDTNAPSRTALFAAAARAAHSLVDHEPYLLVDDASRRLCETTKPSPLDFQLAQPGVPVLAAARLSACARARYADAAVAASGIPQILVLGAGLDTTSFRAPTADMRVWLLDLPDVLAWRARAFACADLVDTGRPVPVDLSEGLDVRELEAAGFDADAPAVVLWLGVSMYLRPEDGLRLVTSLAGLAEGSTLVFDHLLPPGHRDDAGAAYAAAVAQLAGESGEPWLCSASSAAVRAGLARAGWRAGDERDEADAVPEGFWDHQAHLRPMRLVRLVTATRAAS